MKIRSYLTIVWIFFFLAHVGIVSYLYKGLAYIEQDNWRMAIGALNGLYVPYTASICAYIFAKRSRPGERANRTAGGTAIVLTLAWNVLITVQLVSLFGDSRIESVVPEMRDTGNMLSWLVAPAMGFYFGKD